MANHFIEILDDTFIYGEPVARGERLEVDDATLKQLVLCKKAKPCERSEASAPAADPRPKFTRAKPDQESKGKE